MDGVPVGLSIGGFVILIGYVASLIAHRRHRGQRWLTTISCLPAVLVIAALSA